MTTPAPASLVTVEGLSARYGATVALDGVDLAIPPGHIVALIGPNGAGKTTLFRCLFGEHPRTAGRVRLCELDPYDPKDQRRLWTVARWVGDTPVVYDELTVTEHLRLMAQAHGVPPAAVEEAVRGHVESLGLLDVQHRRIGHLSQGNRQKVHVAGGFLSGPTGPRLLVLDEPTENLDQGARRMLFAALRHFVGGGPSSRAVVISSHNLAEFSQLADHIVMLHRGRVVASGTVADLVATHCEDLSYELVLFEPRAAALAEHLAAVPALRGRVEAEARSDGYTVALSCADAAAVGALLAACATASPPFTPRELREARSSLERVFDAVLEGALLDEVGSADDPAPSGL